MENVNEYESVANMIVYAPTAEKLVKSFDALSQSEAMFDNAMADYVKSVAFVMHCWSAMPHDKFSIEDLAKTMCTIVGDMCK